MSRTQRERSMPFGRRSPPFGRRFILFRRRSISRRSKEDIVQGSHGDTWRSTQIIAISTGSIDPLTTILLIIPTHRAVGAGPAGPAAAGPIFGQLTRAKMLYELWWVVQLLL